MAKYKLFDLVKAADGVRVDNFPADSTMWCQPGEFSSIDGDGDEVFNLVPLVVLGIDSLRDYAFEDQTVSLNGGNAKAKTIEEEQVVLEFYRMLPLTDEDMKEKA